MFHNYVRCILSIINLGTTFFIIFFPIADIICCNWCIIKMASVIDPSESDSNHN